MQGLVPSAVLNMLGADVLARGVLLPVFMLLLASSCLSTQFSVYAFVGLLCLAALLGFALPSHAFFYQENVFVN